MQPEPAPKQSWLDLLVNSTKELEPPERFFWWAGLAAISAIVKKNVWLDRFSYILYPNIYVILVSARSGLRKGIPVSYANSIVERVGNTRIIAGRNSVQGIVLSLSKTHTLANNTVVKDAQAFLCAAELDSFMVKDEQGLSILTDLYNTYEHSGGWKNTLKNSPVESLANPCITLLGASNEALLESVIKEKDIEGGFLARTFIIHERRRRSVNSLMYPPVDLIPRSELAEKISYVKDVRGPFKIEPSVRMLYDKWYHALESNEDDRTGTMERYGDHVLKVSMLISLSKSPSLVITKEDFDEAVERCTSLLHGTRKVSMSAGKSDIAQYVAIVLKLMLEAEDNEIERQKALIKLRYDVNGIMFDKVMDDLGPSGQGIVSVYRKPDKKIYYKLKGEIVEQYKKLGGKL